MATTQALRSEARSRVLVVANEPVDGAALAQTLSRRASVRASEVFIVAPALNSRLRHWMSDSDDARSAADVRLAGCLSRARAAGLEARGQVGDSEPLQAIADALVSFAADEILVASQPDDRCNWLGHDLMRRAGDRFGLPVRQISADLSFVTPDWGEVGLSAIPHIGRDHGKHAGQPRSLVTVGLHRLRARAHPSRRP